MLAKEAQKAQKGQKVKLLIHNTVIGVALENLEKGDLVIQDQDTVFPVTVSGFLKMLPGIKLAKK